MDVINGNDESGAVAILDIDHFKKINDTLGHDAGDRALKKLAELLHDMCDEQRHIPARLGGEEFAVFLRGLDARAAYQFCEELRGQVERTAGS